MKDVYMRTPRRWMSLLANNLGLRYSSKNINMFEKPKTFKSSMIFKLKKFLKASFLPPVEWFLPYDLIFKISNDINLIIESGSKLINTSKNYIIYIENGYGLFGYNTKKINKYNLFFFKKKIKEKNLKGFVFYSKFSMLTTKNIFDSLGLSHEFERLNLGVIYPYTEQGNSNGALEKSNKSILFCSSTLTLKGGLEVIECFTKYSEELKSFKLKIITKLQDIPYEFIKNNSNIEFIEFDLSKEDYEKYLSDTYIYLHPTFFDSCPLSLLENISFGIPSIGTNTFAINEFIDNSGIIIENPYHIYNSAGEYQKEGVILDFAEDIIKNHELNTNLVDNIKNAILEIDANYSEYKNKIDVHKSKFNSEITKEKWIDIINEYR
ncbi:glycosyltransferase [Photobacterium damselae]|uniref:glycosyltransferase n=1 Tax=Photobacterium damselae TaxID=38293 RepID=UPI0011D12608|nr:glycosyltransferase [Photobacterium damselae]KAB1515166.1 glycosyltransferase [Photobacterium damselae subsp. damselae]